MGYEKRGVKRTGNEGSERRDVKKERKCDTNGVKENGIRKDEKKTQYKGNKRKRDTEIERKRGTEQREKAGYFFLF